MNRTGIVILVFSGFLIFAGGSFAEAPTPDPKAEAPPDPGAFEREWLKRHPDVELVDKWGREMIRGELELHDHSARDRLVRYAADTSHDEAARAAAVDCLSAVVSEENLKLVASFLTDPSVEVRGRAYLQLPSEVQGMMEDKFGDYDYTRPHPEEDFRDEMTAICKMIEDLTKGKKPKRRETSPAKSTPVPSSGRR